MWRAREDLDFWVRLYLNLSSKNKSTYTMWMTYFTLRVGAERIEFDMLAYWLSWYVLYSGTEDGLNPYVFLT